MNSELPESSERGRPRPPAGARTSSSALPGARAARPHFPGSAGGSPALSPSDATPAGPWRYRGYLPHFDATGAYQFITYRLADSLPEKVLGHLRRMGESDPVAYRKVLESGLDSGAGSCVLRDDSIAGAVVENWKRFDGERYDLIAWVVMPNHVHLLIRQREEHPLADIVHSWKSYTGKIILRGEAGRHFHSGHVWQSDYHDRCIRDENHFASAVAYIHENPVKAGLAKCAESWKWSSVGEAARTPGMRAGPPALPGIADDGVRAPRGDAIRQRLSSSLDSRAALSLERTLSPRPPAPAYVNLADNDYLGLARDPAVIAAGKAALDKWGASSSASPLISGYTEEHAALENELAAWCGFEHGLVWNTGFAANAAVLGALPKPGDLVFADRLIHASMISGILSSGARLIRYPHLDLEKLRELLEKHRGHDGVVWVVTESVFSMDGDYPELKKLASLKNEYGFALVVDEAHATGWFGATGAGLVEREGVAGDVDILVGTLGKGLGGFGAYTLFHDELFRRYLTNFAGEFVYSTYLPPASAACAGAAIRRVREIHAGGFDFAALSGKWREAIRGVVSQTPDGDSPVIPIPVGDAERVMEISRRLHDAGWRVGAIRPPTVPAGESRLRVSLRTRLHENAPADFAGALAEAMR